MSTCYYCQKGKIYGRSHTHHRGVAGGRWKKRAPKTQRIYFPNLQKMNIIEDGKEKRVKLCTKCLKRIKKDIVDKKKPFLQLKSVKQENKSVKQPTKSVEGKKSVEDKESVKGKKSVVIS